MDSQEQMTSEDTVTLSLCCSSVTEQMGVCSLCSRGPARGQEWEAWPCPQGSGLFRV